MLPNQIVSIIHQLLKSNQRQKVFVDVCHFKFFKESGKHLQLIEDISPDTHTKIFTTKVHKIVVSRLITSPRKFIQIKRTMQF